MADFVKKTWACGDSITADELNRLEGGVEEALDCCGSGDAGYECTETRTTLTEESVTTVADGPEASSLLSYSELIAADTLIVILNGTEYVCPARYGYNYFEYGARLDYDTDSFDWSEYPFCISSSPDLGGTANNIMTETAGTYSVKIEELSRSVETTECFKRAVESIAGKQPLYIPRIYDNVATMGIASLGLNNDHVYEDFVNGRLVFVVYDNIPYKVLAAHRFTESCSGLVGYEFAVGVLASSFRTDVYRALGDMDPMITA